MCFTPAEPPFIILGFHYRFSIQRKRGRHSHARTHTATDLSLLEGNRGHVDDTSGCFPVGEPLHEEIGEEKMAWQESGGAVANVNKAKARAVTATA